MYGMLGNRKPTSHLFATIGSNGTFSRPNVPPGKYVLRIEAKDLSSGEKNVMTTVIELDASEDHCTTHLINRGLRVEGQTLTVEFTSTGQFDGFTCILNRRMSLCKFSPGKSHIISYMGNRSFECCLHAS